MVYCITYDLNKSGKDYKGVIQAIKDAGDQGCCSFGKSAWLIKSSIKSAQAIYSMIEPHIDSDDTCLVIEAKLNYAGRFEDYNIEIIRDVIFKPRPR